MRWPLLLAVSVLWGGAVLPLAATARPLASMPPEAAPATQRLKDQWDDWDESIDDEWIRERDRRRDRERDDRDYRDRDDFDGIDDRRGRDRDDVRHDRYYRDDRYDRERYRDDYYRRDRYHRDGRRRYIRRRYCDSRGHCIYRLEELSDWRDDWDDDWGDDWGDRPIYRRHTTDNDFRFILRILESLD